MLTDGFVLALFEKEYKEVRHMYPVLDVCRFIIEYSNQCEYGVSNLKLQKLLYFEQAYFLTGTEDGRPCFSEKIEAWDFGPVVPDAYRQYKQYGSMDIPTPDTYFDFDNNNIWDVERKKYDPVDIRDEDKNLMQTVIDGFARFSATDLVALTHRQAPWIDAYTPYKNNEITQEAIKRYFEKQ